MSESRYTPGPWSVGMANGSNVNIICAPGDDAIAQMYGVPFNSTMDRLDAGRWSAGLANARLIAAAPETLDALKEMVRWHAKRGGPDDTPLSEDEQDPEVAQAMRAIARAEGRT